MYTKKTADDVQDAPRKTLTEGWYQVAIKKTEAKVTKASQGMLSYQAGVLSEEDNPDSAKASVFGMVLLDAFEDEAAFEADLASKTGLEGSELDEKITARKRMGVDAGANFGLAIFGRGEFCAVPTKDAASGEYVLPNGEVVTDYNERQNLYKQRKAEAYNATLGVVTGETDITRYMCYAKIVTEKYNGNEKNAVKSLRETLPAGESLLTP